MRMQRSTRLMTEPPSMATGDIAFNLIVFFLVCASTAPDSGHRQNIPSSETVKQPQKREQQIMVQLTRTAMLLNGDPLRPAEFTTKLQSLLRGKTVPEQRVVVVKSREDVPYEHWIAATGIIEKAGGIITIQREEEREVQIGN